jgi:hypothetical protein
VINGFGLALTCLVELFIQFFLLVLSDRQRASKVLSWLMDYPSKCHYDLNPPLVVYVLSQFLQQENSLQLCRHHQEALQQQVGRKRMANKVSKLFD